MNILEAMADPHLFGPWFNGSSWDAWRGFLAALYGLPVPEEQLALYRELTGRQEAPTVPAREAWLLCGRRAGKSRILSLIAIYQACFHDWRPYLTPGERGVVLCVAADRSQAKVIFSYIAGMIEHVPLLQGMVANVTKEQIELNNGITIECGTASYRTIRGRTVVCALLDEICFWMTAETSANPDSEVLAAVRPSVASVPGSLILAASSPYSRRGVAYETFRRHWGQGGSDILVWAGATTRQMNPNIPQSIVDAAMEADPDSAKSEYLGQWRDDISAFISRDVINSLAPHGLYEIERRQGHQYSAFVDAASGGGRDSFTLGIAHYEDGRGVLDAVREIRPPFSPNEAARELAEFAKSYGLGSVTGDKWAAGFVAEAFQENGLSYTPSELAKSDIYRECLPLLNSGKVQLLDNQRLISQLCGLERKTTRGTGKDIIDHAPNAHDDIANAACGALHMVSGHGGLGVWQRLADNPEAAVIRWSIFDYC